MSARAGIHEDASAQMMLGERAGKGRAWNSRTKRGTVRTTHADVTAALLPLPLPVSAFVLTFH